MAIRQGSVTIGQEIAARAADPIVNGRSSVTPDKEKLSPQGNRLVNVITNPLEKYASYSPLWTLACLETSEFNNPASYRATGKLKHVVFSSAGRYDQDRVTLFSGKAPEYFVDNFRMSAFIAPTVMAGNSNVVKFEFEVYEPYSMGLFLQSLQLAAINANYSSYLIAPFVLKLDFLGYDDNQEVIKPVNGVRSKFFVLKLTKVTFNVTGAGSKYSVEAVPYNHQSFADNQTTVYNDIQLSGSTVEEALRTGENSLVSALNTIEQNLVASGRIGVADVYDIQFPKDAFDFAAADTAETTSTTSQRASVSPSARPARVVKGESTSDVLPPMESSVIGEADYGFDSGSGGLYTFVKNDEQRDPETGIVELDNVTIDPKSRSFQFAQGQSILNIINTMILNSRYVFEALKPENKIDGKVRHFMIDVQTEFLEFDPLIGENAQKITFRVVPYLVHESIFQSANAVPAGYNEIENEISKRYNYIYSGQNTDVLNFNIQINNLFYVGMNTSAESNNYSSANKDAGGTSEATDTQTKTGGEDASPAAQISNVGRYRPQLDPATQKKLSGGSGQTSTEQQVAESFHRVFLEGTSGDLVKINMEILGDPYWLVDHGIANHLSSAPSETSSITDEGAMNYTSGSIYIYITFRTADDINEFTGLSEFSPQVSESPFSGIYRVVKCENEFTGGNFKQKLDCVRMIGQFVEYKDIPEVSQQLQVTTEGSNILEEAPPTTAGDTLIKDPTIQSQ